MLRPYSAEGATCQKCGASPIDSRTAGQIATAGPANIETVYCVGALARSDGRSCSPGSHEVGEHFHRICGNCGYEWLEAVLG